MKLKEIKDVPFPAVTICHNTQTDWKWPGIMNAMNSFDTENKLLKTSKSLSDLSRPAPASGIGRMQLAYVKSKEFQDKKHLTDFDFIKDTTPEPFQNMTTLIHYVAFSEQNKSMGLYNLRQFMDLIWRRHLDYKFEEYSSNEIALKLEEDICSGETNTLNINATVHCQVWKEDNITNGWYEKCHGQQECLSKNLYFKKNYVSKLLLIERYINKQTMLDSFIGYYRKDPTLQEKIYQLDQKITWNNVSAIMIWSKLNGGQKVFENNDEFYNKSIKGFVPQDLSTLAETFSKPMINGPKQEDYSIVPICGFNLGGHHNKKMEKCNLFLPSQLTLDQKRCFTFNGNESNPLHGEGMGPQNGLNLLLSYRIPRDKYDSKVETLRLILHEPGTVADIQHRTNTFVDIEPGKQYIIGTDQTILTSTESFGKLSYEKRQCELNKINGTYHQSNCLFDKMIEHGIKQCSCLPWYMHYVNTSVKVCWDQEFVCFEELIEDEKTTQHALAFCPPACDFISYTLKVSKEQKLEKQKFDYEEINANILASYLGESLDTHPFLSVVQINFDYPYATEITQDAKVTFADMVGSIGGTFGVFLGLSFVSLVDELADWILWLKKACCKN